MAVMTRRWRSDVPYALLIMVLVGGVFSDLVSVLLSFSGSGFWRMSLILRTLFLVGTFATLLVQWQKRWNSYLVFLGALVVSGLSLLTGYLSDPIFEVSAYVDSLLLMIKFTFVFFIFLLIKQAVRTGSRLTTLAKMVDWVIVSYVFFILLGAVTGLEVFRSYGGDYVRPGFKGIIYAQNEATGFMIVANAWFFARMAVGARSWLWLALAFLASVCVGTKGLLLAIPIMLVGMIKVTYGTKRALFLSSVAIVLISGAAWGAYLTIDQVRAAVDLFWSYVSFAYENQSNGSLMSVLITGRDIKFEELITLVSNNFPWVLLVGGAPIGGHASESDPIDLTVAFGLPFLLLFLTAYWQMAIGFVGITSVWARQFLGIFMIIVFLVALTGGHIWASAVCAPFIALLIFYVQRIDGMHAGQLVPKEGQ